jgi:hypothetical protein
MRLEWKEAGMFKRRSTYVMEISGLIHFPLDELRAANEEFAASSDDELRAAVAQSLSEQVMEVATEELKRNRQKLKDHFEGGGYRWDTGSEITVNRLGEHHVDFTVAFEGDHAGATAAAEAWRERVETFGGIDRITRAALRGTDGTNLQWLDEEILELAANLDDDTKARIDEVMDPNRRDDV